MDQEREKYLRAVAKAADQVKLHHKDLQKKIERGTRDQVFTAGTKVIESTQKLLTLVAKDWCVEES